MSHRLWQTHLIVLFAYCIGALLRDCHAFRVIAKDASSQGSHFFRGTAMAEVSLMVGSNFKANESWFAGIFLTLLGQTVCVLGMQIQKFSHMVHTPSASPNKPRDCGDGPLRLLTPSTSCDNENELADEAGYYFVQWRWLLGAIVWGLGHIMCWVALGLAPQSILSCLQSWNMVAALFFAPLLLKEKSPPYAWFHGGLIVFGCVTVVLFGPRTDEYQMETVDSLQAGFLTRSSMAVHIISLLIGFLCTVGLSPDSQRWRVERYIVISAICAWYAALFSKSLSMFVITTVAAHDSQLKSLGFYAFAFLFVLFALGQIHYLNLGLKYGLATAVLPTYEAVSMVGQLFFGGIMFGEFHYFKSYTEYGFIPGVIVIFVGLALLIRSTREMTEANKEDEQLTS